MLAGYEQQRQALEGIPEELKRLELNQDGLRGAKLDGGPSAKDIHAREDALISNIARRDDLARRLEEARLWVQVVDNGLSFLDADERAVLEGCYVHRRKGAVDDLCERLCMDRATVYRLRVKALRRFTRALYGVTESL